MAIAIDPADILERVAFRLHLPTFASGEFVSDDQALMLLKDACERLSGLLLRAYGSDFFSQQATVNTQTGVDLVSLPEGLATIESVYWLAPGGQEVQLRHAYRLDGYTLPEVWEAPSDYRAGFDVPTYRVEGNALVLRPVPAAVYSLRVDYQTTPTITAITDTIFGQSGWREWLVLDVCEQIADRAEKDPSRFTARKMKVEADLKTQGAGRDKGTRRQPVDAYGLMTNGRRDWRFR